MRMTPEDVRDVILARLHASIALVPEDNIYRLMNHYLREFYQRILRYNREFFLTHVKLDLVAGQREYTLQAGGAPIHAVRQVMADLREKDTDPRNMVVLKPVYVPIPIADDDELRIQATFANMAGGAFYELRGNKIFLYTGKFVSVTEGLYVEYYAPFKIITNNNKTQYLDEPDSTGVGLPSYLHQVLTDAVSYAIKTSGDKVIPVLPEEQMWRERLEEILLEFMPNPKMQRRKVKIPNILR